MLLHKLSSFDRATRSCALLVALLLFSQFAGCATHAKRLASPRAAFYGNDLTVAHKQLTKLNSKSRWPSSRTNNDVSVVELDLAMVEMLQGNFDQAEGRLRQVRDTWDHLEQKSLAEEAASYVTDDKRIAYSGEDYERLLVRVMLTMCSLMSDGIDAESYSLQTLSKQQDLLASAKSKWNKELPPSYCVPPIAPYLRGVLKEASLRDYNEALRYYRAAGDLLPESSILQDDIARAEHGVHSSPGNGVIYVIAMVGRGPFKTEVSQPATQAALQVADVILSQIGEYTLPPTLAPVKVPQIVCPEKPFDLVGVEINGTPVSTTLPITDLHMLATTSYAEKLPTVMARTIARRVIKKGAVYAAKDQFNANSDIASLAFDAAGVLWEASESADTRSWGLLPREIQVLRIELPAGEHQLALEPITAATPVGTKVPCDVRVVNGKNTYVLSYWPDLQPIGRVLVSR